MFSRFPRPWLPGVALVGLALLPNPECCRAQDPGPAAGDVVPRSPRKPESVLRASGGSRPPAPGELVNPAAPRHSGEPRKRVPPILIAFVLLFLITWVRTHLERRRLRASLRQSCEPIPPQVF